jgi:hypothetical protein
MIGGTRRSDRRCGRGQVRRGRPAAADLDGQQRPDQGGQLEVTDGPFAETKEQLGGFYILDCDDLDEAIAYARKIPAAEHGSIEVRPVWEVPVRA